MEERFIVYKYIYTKVHPVLRTSVLSILLLESWPALANLDRALVLFNSYKGERVEVWWG